MGQNGALSGHEVPGGEVVRLLGKLAEHLLIRPATPPRCCNGPGLKVTDAMLFFFVIVFLIGCSFSEGSLRRRKSRPQASLTATHSSTLAEEIVAVLRTLHSLSQWNSLINDYINNQLSSIADVMASCQSEAVRFIVAL